MCQKRELIIGIGIIHYLLDDTGKFVKMEFLMIMVDLMVKKAAFFFQENFLLFSNFSRKHFFLHEGRVPKDDIIGIN
jgi:hypothetical protein